MFIQVKKDISRLLQIHILKVTSNGKINVYIAISLYREFVVKNGSENAKENDGLLPALLVERK